MAFRCTENVLPKKKDEPPAKKGPDVPTGEEKIPPAEEPLKKKAGEIKKRYDDRKIASRMDALKR